MKPWLRRLVLVLGVVLLGVVATSVQTADVGRADPLPTPVERIANGSATSSELDAWWQRIIGNAYTGGQSGEIAAADAGERRMILSALLRARIAAGVLPEAAPIIGGVALAAVGAYVGWRVYQHFTNGDTVQVDMWLDSGALGKDSLFNMLAVPFGSFHGWETWTPPWDCSLFPASCPPFGTSVGSVGGVAWAYTERSQSDAHGCGWMPGWSAGQGCLNLNLNPMITGTGTDGSGNKYPATCPNGPVSASGGTCSVWSDSRFTEACTSTLGSGQESPACPWNYDQANAIGQVNHYPQAGGPGGSSPPDALNDKTQLWYAVQQTIDQLCASNANVVCADGAADTATNPSVHRVRVGMLVAGARNSALVQQEAPLGTPDRTTNFTVPSRYANPGGAGSESDKQAAVGVILADPCASAWVDHVLEPLSYGMPASDCVASAPAPAPQPQPSKITIPQPSPSDTYATYALSLRNAGLLGMITEEILTDADPDYAQSAVEGVRVGTGALVHPLSWPAAGILVDANTGVTVTVNPGTDTAAPPFVGGTPGAGCNCPGLDLTPLTSQDYSGKFPFGVFSWVGGWIGALSGTATAPVFDFNFGWLGITPHYVVDMSILDAYMQTIRTILAWCLWIGAVWWIGSRLLGYDATGDVGAAVDDAWS